MILYMAKYVSRDVHDQIYTLYVRLHLDYGDIIYHSSGCKWSMEGTNIDSLYEELGWESLYYRGWYRRLCHFIKLTINQSPAYLYQLVPLLRSVKYNLRGANVYESNVERTNRFASTYFQNCIKE